MGVRAIKLIIAITLAAALGIIVARQLKVPIHATSSPKLKVINPSDDTIFENLVVEEPTKLKTGQKDKKELDEISNDTRQNSKAKENNSGTKANSDSTPNKVDIKSPETSDTEKSGTSANQQGQDQNKKVHVGLDEVKKDEDAPQNKNKSKKDKPTADDGKKEESKKEAEIETQNKQHEESGLLVEERKQKDSKEEHKDKDADKAMQFHPDASERKKDMSIQQENQGINIEQEPSKTTAKPPIQGQPKINDNTPAAINTGNVQSRTTPKPTNQEQINGKENIPAVIVNDKVPSKTTQSPKIQAKPKVEDNITVVHNLTISNLSPDMGHQLFALATLLGVGYRNKMNIVLPPGLEKLENNLEMGEIRKYPTKQTAAGAEFGGFDYLYKRKDREYDDRTEHLSNLGLGNIEMNGYYHSWKYFRGIENKIRKEFTFKADIRSKVQKYISDKTGGKNVTLVGIHVQRGDFLLESAKKMGDAVASKEYIQRAIAFFENHFPNVWFFVAGDGDDWSKENVKASRLTHSTGLSQMEDLALMAACDHVIATTGTFSWWAGWLARGITIYYEGYPIPDTPLWKGFKKEDFFPPHWILMK